MTGCSVCGKQKLADIQNLFSNPQVDRCICDFLQADSTNAANTSATITICARCTKKIESGRHGSLTQWIFRHDLCSCETPEPRITTSELLAPTAVQRNSLQQVRADEPEIEVDPKTFPLENYKPIQLIGHGASGRIWKCRNRYLGHIVAIKTLRRVTPRLMLQLQHEAKTVSKLVHPNIVQVKDFGLTADGNPFMVTEFVEGISLSKLLSDRDNLGWRKSINIIIQICDGLIFAHGNDIYHRDLNCDNILLEDAESINPSAKLIDFGLALSISFDRQTITDQGLTIVGTPPYMSPDQTTGESYDARSEVYSIGCVLFHCIAGRPPFIGDSALEILLQHAESPVPVLQEFTREAIPAELERIVQRSLEKDRDDRFSSVDQLKQALLTVLADNPVFIKQPGHRKRYVVEQKDDDLPRKRTLKTAVIFASGIVVCSTMLATLIMYPWLQSKNAADAAEKLGPVAVIALAQTGNGDAQVYLGKRYLKGDGTSTDPDRALSLFRSAQAKGYTSATGLIGYCYLMGLGTPREETKARELFLEASKKGDGLSERMLAINAFHRFKIAEAVDLLRRASKHGDAIAGNMLAAFIINSQRVDEYQLAEKLLTEAAEQNIRDAEFNLAYLNERGMKTINRNEAKAVALFRKAAQEGDAEACYRLGLMLETGRGVSADKAEAFRCYTNAANQKNSNGELAVSRCYKYGIGTKSNLPQADIWLQSFLKNRNSELDEVSRLLLSQTLNIQGLRNYRQRALMQQISRIQTPNCIVSDHEGRVRGIAAYPHDCDLIQLQGFPRIDHLTASRGKISLSGIKQLADLSLSSIDLDYSVLDDNVLFWIAKQPQINAVKLNYSSGFSEVGLKALSKLEKLTELEVVPDGKPISQSWLSKFTGLKTLTIGDNVNNHDLGALNQLSSLTIESNGGKANLVPLKETRISTLSLTLQDIDDSIVRDLSQVSSLYRLYLYLEGKQIGDDSIRILSKLPPQIARLSLCLKSTAVTDEGLSQIRDFKQPKISLSISHHKFSHQAIKKLKADSPKLKVYDHDADTRLWRAQLGDVDIAETLEDPASALMRDAPETPD